MLSKYRKTASQMDKERRDEQITQQRLCEVLKSWCKRQGLLYLCAEELMLENKLTKEQRRWLKAYVVVWEGCDNA